MNTVRLYGKGAAVVMQGKQEIRSSGGQINVPEGLVAHMLDQGWSRYPLNDEVPDALHKLEAPDAAALMPGAPLSEDPVTDQGEGPE
jgi:hypothetical protein